MNIKNSLLIMRIEDPQFEFLLKQTELGAIRIAEVHGFKVKHHMYNLISAYEKLFKENLLIIWLLHVMCFGGGDRWVYQYLK